MRTRGCINTKCGMEFRPGKKRSNGCWRRLRNRCEYDDEPDRANCQRGAIRGIHAISVSPVGGEEPATMEFRSAVPARAQRVAAGKRFVEDADGVPGVGQRECGNQREGAISAGYCAD